MSNYANEKYVEEVGGGGLVAMPITKLCPVVVFTGRALCSELTPCCSSY